MKLNLKYLILVEMRGPLKLRLRLVKVKTIWLLACGIILFLCYLQVVIHLDAAYYKRFTTPTPPIAILNKPVQFAKLQSNENNNQSEFLKIPSKMEFRMNWIKNKIEKIEKHSEKWNIMKLLNSTGPLAEPNNRVHIFYYSSFRNLEIDGQWSHWNKDSYILSDAKSKNGNLHVTGSFIPPMNICSNYYPMLGCYSSRDPQIIKIHFKQIRDAGVGVVIVFWLLQETKNQSEDIKKLLNEAEKNQLKLAFCIEAFSSSSANELFKNIHFITNSYSTHPAFYKLMKKGRYLPVYYLFNSHLAPASEWRKLLASEGSQSIRGTPYDGFFIGLLIDVHHKVEITRSHFDGFYTYFSSNGCYYGSSWKNWKALEEFAEKNQLLFFPTVSPGYIDTKVRPWNTALTRHRSHGHYYQVAWRSAISAKPFGVSITSYNNWEEGSQIEPAKSKVTSQFTYLDYHPEGSYFYLNLTRYWVKQLTLTSK